MMQAADLLVLLANKHSEDVFVSECKGGPTWYAEHRRLDAWAMKRSWAHEAMYGYEIKISRGDFLHDDKWRAYLQYCNLFYFVAPSKKIIDPAELPEEAGLLIASTNATRLYTIKKAPHRHIEPPADLLKYLLMSRTKIIGQHSSSEGADAWRVWLKEKREWHKIGVDVSIKLHKLLGEAQNAVRDAEAKANNYELIKQRLTELGYDSERPVNEWNVRRRVDDLVRNGMPDGLTANAVNYLAASLQRLASQLAELENRGG